MAPSAMIRGEKSKITNEAAAKVREEEEERKKERKKERGERKKEGRRPHGGPVTPNGLA
jgi:hypothetical protein